MTRVGRVRPAFVHRNPRGSAKTPQLGCSPAFSSKSINSDLIKWRNYFQELKSIQSVLSTLKGQTLWFMYFLAVYFYYSIDNFCSTFLLAMSSSGDIEGISSGSSNIAVNSPKKKIRIHSTTKFHRQWSSEWPCIQPLVNDTKKAFCTVREYSIHTCSLLDV